MALRLVPTNFLDTDHCTDLAATSEASATLLAATNLQSNVRDKVWRSTSLASQSITGSWGGNVRQISMWGIWPAGDGTSSLIGATERVRLWRDVAKTDLVYDSGTIDHFTFTGENYNTFLWGVQQWGVDNADKTARLAPRVKWFTAVPASAFQIDIANAGAVDTNYFESRRICLGDYVEAPYNALFGASPQWKSASELQRTVGGSLRRLTRARWRELRFETVFGTEADRARWSDLQYLCDPSREIVISIFPGDSSEKKERDFTVLGSLEVLNPMVFENPDFHRLQLAILES